VACGCITAAFSTSPIAVFADDRPCFAALAECDHQSERLRVDYFSRTTLASYVVFDILYAKESSIMDLPLRERTYFGSPLLGACHHGLLQYVGKVGSGFTDKELAEIAGAFSPLDRSPFVNAPATAEVRWVEPNLVGQVSAREVTKDGHLRAPVFLRTRDDKEPQECTMDQLD